MQYRGYRNSRQQRGARTAVVVLTAALVATTATIGTAVAAENFPVRPVRLIVPFSAGGATDGPARLFALEMSKLLGQPMLVENRPGAGGVVGAEIAAKATPDGYTLFMTSNTHFVSAAIHKKLPYDPINDFTGVTGVTSALNVMVVHPSLRVKTIAELIALAKKRPGEIDWASSGNGGTQHLTGALFTSMAGVKMVHVPYRGSAPAMADLVGGQVGVGFPGIAGVIGFVNSGKLRALGVTSTRRSALMPNVPTIAEAGVRGYELVAWFGLAGPRNLPEPVVSQLHRLSLKALATPDTITALAAVGSEPFTHDSPARFLAFMKEDAPKWAKLARESGATID